MKAFRVTIFVCLVCLYLVRVGSAQDIVGSTTVDIDPDSGTVTATCETDVDGDVETYYISKVACTVHDQNGNVITSGTGTGSPTQGPALVVLTFTGVPGTTYTATGAHSVMSVIVEHIVIQHQPTQTGYDDEFNFSSFSEDPQTYDDNFDWEGPGPETITVINTYRVGNTTATATDPQIPTYFFSTGATPVPSGCDAGTYGTFFDIAYYVSDQSGSRMNIAGITPLEIFGTLIGGGTIGYASFATPVSTTSTGSFDDVPLGSCVAAPPLVESCINVYQYFQATLNGITYPISTFVSRRECTLGQTFTLQGNPSGQNVTYTQGVVE